jgi:hypothetical protein
MSAHPERKLTQALKKAVRASKTQTHQPSMASNSISRCVVSRINSPKTNTLPGPDSLASNFTVIGNSEPSIFWRGTADFPRFCTLFAQPKFGLARFYPTKSGFGWVLPYNRPRASLLQELQQGYVNSAHEPYEVAKGMC